MDSDEPGAYVYMLRCVDGSYYIGSARHGLERRVGEHNEGVYGGYTSTRRPVTLVWVQHFQRWSRAKKEALIRGDYDAMQILAKRRT